MTLPSETGALGIFWMFRSGAPGPVRLEPRLPTLFQRLSLEEVAELSQVMGFASPEPVLQRLQAGKACYIARVSGRLVAYGWITYDQEEIGELGLKVCIQPGEAYIWDCGTIPPYRGQRLYASLLSYMLGELQSAGLRRIWIGTDSDNLPSQGGMALAGFLPILEIVQDQQGKLVSRSLPGVADADFLDAHAMLFGNNSLTYTSSSSEVDQ